MTTNRFVITMRMTIDHVIQGQPGQCYSCPVALAVRQPLDHHISGGFTVEADVGTVVVMEHPEYVDSLRIDVLRDIRYSRMRWRALLPAHVVDWISHFDSRSGLVGSPQYMPSPIPPTDLEFVRGNYDGEEWTYGRSHTI